ncbi:PREDICTED: auxin-responsive protein SAUR50-like [Ipomoea nil]|uniref:auxin-responsive protein SAUR50-like n=1 Tax=Ipomoea nil TaxID=35883 RepID=UPI00090174C6|nr:PREDICTED: auxin-responsive protein SAUR50-like [Ipomoea nil]
MGKGEMKLTKLKSVLKKMKSFKLGRSNAACSAAGNSSSFSSSDDESSNYYAYNSSDDKNNLHPVYVGKSRRRYLVGPDVVDHPVFQELVERSTSGNSEDSIITVGCEVVLFDHFLWMLENGDPQPPECLDELAGFYT